MSQPMDERRSWRMKIGRKLWPACVKGPRWSAARIRVRPRRLTAGWIAGHILPGDPVATDQMREELLQLHIDAIRKMIPVNEAELYPELKR